MKALAVASQDRHTASSRVLKGEMELIVEDVVEYLPNKNDDVVEVILDDLPPYIPSENYVEEAWEINFQHTIDSKGSTDINKHDGACITIEIFRLQL